METIKGRFEWGEDGSLVLIPDDPKTNLSGMSWQWIPGWERPVIIKGHFLFKQEPGIKTMTNRYLLVGITDFHIDIKGDTFPLEKLIEAIRRGESPQDSC